MHPIYLDNASTTPILPEVREAMLPYLSGRYGNPSSLHSLGREARQAIEDARLEIAEALGAAGDEIVFTSGGSEADNLAIKGVACALRRQGRHIITTAIEHHAVLRTCHFLEKEGFRVTYLPVDGDGLVDPLELQRAITDDTILVSIMHANNEVGTIEPIKELSQIAREESVVFHTDAVQTFGHLPIAVNRLGVDLLSMSAHKLNGPKGIGALYVRNGTPVEPLIHGGAQEKKRRASTENVPGVVGFGTATRIAAREMGTLERSTTRLRNRLLNGILRDIEYTRLNGHPTMRLPGNINTTIRYVDGESVVLAMDRKGICISTASACATGDPEPSHVLTAMGINSLDIHSAVRISLGRENTRKEIDTTQHALAETIQGLREISPLYPPGPSDGQTPTGQGR